MDLKQELQDFRASWDRETTLTFSSLLVGAYAWVVNEHMLVGIAVGVAMHAITVAVYEYLAYRQNWPHLKIADMIRAHVLPHFSHLRERFSKTQNA